MSVFNESLHPRVKAGTGGGEFSSGGSGSSSAKPAAKTSVAKKTTAAAHPHGSLAFDGHTGPGYGEKGGDKRVHSLQEDLNRLGITDGSGKKLADDGKLGPRTTAAVKKAQRALGLKPDGVVTPALLKQLSSAKHAGDLKPDAKKTAAPAKKAGGATATPRTPAKHVPPHSTKRHEVPMIHETLTPETYRRSYALDNIEIVSRAKGGDGRTVEAYAAVFGVRTEVHDQHGDYIEENDPAMFNRTINNGAVKRAIVLYNHGFDARGKSGGLPTVPIGRPVEIKADRRGLLTVSRYNNSEFADTVLESIKNGDIRAQSYEGPIYRSTPDRVPKVRRGGPLPLVRRMEMGLKNYGPTPTPYYEEAEITAVRSAVELAEEVARLDAEQRAELIRALSATPGWDPETAHILATPHGGPGAEDSRDSHSVRLKLIRLKAELRERNL
jgi:peptidoglycan hydrolase-like protein with peptidoglycan-binding domain/phage head maturation protease